MSNSERRELLLISLFYLTGFVWVLCALVFDIHITVCPSKLIYGMPCPGCGTTRALTLLLGGHPLDAAMMNPNIYILIIALVTLPVVLLMKHLTGRDYLLRFNQWLERKSVLIPFLLIELGIWLKNIIQGV